MTPVQKVADTSSWSHCGSSKAIESGHRPNQIDANDLLETLLSVADRLDPHVATEAGPSLLDAARALLEARENQMVTRLEWEQLELAVAAAR